MKHILLALATVFFGIAEVQAYDYAYLVLQKADGSTVQVSTTGLSLSLKGSAATLTVNNVDYQVEDLSYMYFSNSETPDNIVAIPSVGWATFCSASALDFTSVDGLTAYKAAANASTLTLSSLSSAIPANTGIVLQGSEGTYHVPVAASASALTGNDLLGTTTALTTTSDYSYYALRQIDDATVGFCLVQTGVAIPAGKAYYRTSALSAPTYYLMDTDNSATAIDEQLKATTDDAGTWYTLDGRQLNGKPSQKGLYIKNGKKYIVK